MMEISNNNETNNTEGGNNNESRNNSTTSVSTMASSNTTTQPAPAINNSMSYNNININLNRLNSTSLLTRAIERNNQNDDEDDEEGLNADPDHIFPVEFTQRGLYKYYALSK
ncbi:unnamed protein product [[Candida] boidinii]|nr:unnamed protein product [[Candida] boidinii]